MPRWSTVEWRCRRGFGTRSGSKELYVCDLDGGNLRLTLDVRVQKLLEEALRFVSSGAAVVIGSAT